MEGVEEEEEEVEAARLSCDARDQVNLTATPLTQDGSVSDISRVCTIFQRASGEGWGRWEGHTSVAVNIHTATETFFSPPAR